MKQSERIRIKLIQWNNKFPFDYLYRQKYKIGFGSPQHKKLIPHKMWCEFMEEKIMEEHYSKIVSEKKLTEVQEESNIIKYHENVIDQFNTGKAELKIPDRFKNC